MTETQIIGINLQERGWSVIETTIPYVVGKTPIIKIFKKGLTGKQMRKELEKQCQLPTTKVVGL